MQRLRTAIDNTLIGIKNITKQYCTRTIGIKAVAIAACTIAGLTAHPTLAPTFNAIAWLVVEAINEQSDRG